MLGRGHRANASGALGVHVAHTSYNVCVRCTEVLMGFMTKQLSAVLNREVSALPKQVNMQSVYGKFGTEEKCPQLCGVR